MTSPATKPQDLGRRRWRLLLAVLLLVALPPALLLGWRSWRQHALRTELAALLAATDQNDPGWRLEQLLAGRPSIPVAENAAPIISQAAAAMPRLWPSEEFSNSNALSDEEFTRQHRLRPYALALIRKELAACAEARRLAEPLDRFRRGRFDAVPPKPTWWSNFNEQLHQVRALQDVLRLEALAAMDRQDGAEALRAVRRMLTLSAAPADEPHLFPQLLRIALRSCFLECLWRLLGQFELEPAQLASLQEELQADASGGDGLLLSLRGERAGLDRLLEAYGDGRLEGYEEFLRAFAGGRLFPAERTGIAAVDQCLHRLLDAPPGGSPEEERLRTLSALNQLLAIRELPEERRLHEIKAWHAALPEGFSLVRQLSLGWVKVAALHAKGHAALRAAIGALACERFRREKGRWPNGWTELVPVYLSAPPLDPFAGKPLQLRLDATGLVIYSLGEDGLDDGGAVEPGYDRQGVYFKPKDHGVRLYHPSLRRQAPRPAPLFDGQFEKLAPHLPLPG